MSIRRIRPDERTVGDPTPGIVREAAHAGEVMWSGLARTAPGATSGWHHHGDNETTVYVVRGLFHLEYGAAGAESVTAEPGDFVYIPSRTVHRESNPSSEESHLVVVRAGQGPPTINVDGPGG